MKENVVQGIITVIITGVSAYFGVIAIPFIVLAIAMAIDYITGLIYAKKTTGLDSRVGIFGIVKKLCYIALVGVGAIVDYLLYAGMAQIGVESNCTMAFGLLVTIWLIINELISILENLGKIGVPLPSFLTNMISRLKNTVENKTGTSE